jgi:hypothetical protein
MFRGWTSTIVGEVFPSRIEVLDKALESAELSKQFRHRRRLFKLLWKLANGYWYALASGRSDAEARLPLVVTMRLRSRIGCRTIDVRGNEGHLHTKGDNSK